MEEFILKDEGILTAANKEGVLPGWETFIARWDELVKAFLRLRWLERIDNYWENYEKRNFSRKWKSFQRSGQWF